MDMEDRQIDVEVRRALRSVRWSNICRILASSRVPMPRSARFRMFYRATICDREAQEAIDRLGPDSGLVFTLSGRGRFGARARIEER